MSKEFPVKRVTEDYQVHLDQLESRAQEVILGYPEVLETLACKVRLALQDRGGVLAHLGQKADGARLVQMVPWEKLVQTASRVKRVTLESRALSLIHI